MRILLLPVVAFALTGATENELPKDLIAAENSAPSELSQIMTRDTLRKSLLRNTEECRDRITKAREVFGKSPLLDRETASPDKPLLIYAVDRRQDGCSVMVMKGDLDDIRPLPAPMEDPLRIIPVEDAEK